jgi:hypothetical protein
MIQWWNRTCHQSVKFRPDVSLGGATPGLFLYLLRQSTLIIFLQTSIYIIKVIKMRMFISMPSLMLLRNLNLLIILIVFSIIKLMASVMFVLFFNFVTDG